MDLRLLPLSVGLWLSTLGTLLVASRQSPFLLFIWVITLVFLTFALVKQKIFRNWSIVSTKYVVIGFCVGFILALLRLEPLTTEPLNTISNEHAVITVAGQLIDDVKRSKVTNSLDLDTRDFGVFKFRISQIEYRDRVFKIRIPVQVFISGENLARLKAFPPGTELSFVGKVRAGQLIRGYAAELTVLGPIEVIQTPPMYQYIAAKLRLGLHRSLATQNPQVAGLVPGLAVGDVSNLSSELAADMKSAGLTHLTAVSGSNVTLLIAVVIALGSRFNLTTRTKYFVSLIALAGFVVIVRPQPSVLRATIMGLIMVLAIVSKSPKSPLPALTGAVIGLIALDPWLSISFGFALSVFATAGLLLWAKAILRSLDRLLPTWIPEWLVAGLVVTISAQLAVFPILIGLGSPISFGSLPANLISVPLAGPTMGLGLIAAFSSQIWLPLGIFFGWLATIPAWGIVLAAKFFAIQSWLNIPWPQGAGGIILAVLVLISGVQAHQRWPKTTPAQKHIAATTWLVLASLLWLKPMVNFRNWVPANWQLVSCDIGQGDATVIRISKHEAVLVDVGGDPELIDRCLTQLEVDSIPLLLLTHFHADHVVGLSGVLPGRTIGEIRISPLAQPELTTKFVQEVLSENNLTASILSYPDYLKIGSLELFCIWPHFEIDQTSDTPNNASVSLLIQAGDIRILLPGDLEEPAQEAALNLVSDLAVDVIKIPHHGSRNQSVKFAQRSQARIAIVSVGADNEYGHPAPETIFLYESIGAKVIRTDQHGSVAVSSTQGNLVVSTQK